MRQSGYFFVFVFLLTIFSDVPSFASENTGSLLNEFVDTALANNPKVKSSYNEWKKEEYKIKSARSLPDPKLSYGYFGESIETRNGPQQQKYGLSQTFPFPGKRGLMSEAQEKRAGMLKEKYEEVKRDIISEVKVTYYDLFWVDKAVQINEGEKSLIEDLEKTAQKKYESNLLPQQDVIKIQVELSNIIKKLMLLRQNRKILTLKMKALLNEQGKFTVPEIHELQGPIGEFQLGDLLMKAKEGRQELKGLNLEVQKAEIEKELAEKNYLPDFTISYEYTQIGAGSTTSPDDGKDSWMGMLSINLPVWDARLSNDVKGAESELAAVKNKKQDLENMVVYDVNDAYLRVETNKDIISLYDSALIPQAEQAFDVSQKAFETGSVSFIDWLDTERTYLQTRLAYYKALSDYYKSIALLEKAVGNKIGGENEK